MGCEVFIAAECTGSVHGDRDKPLSDAAHDDDGEWPRLAHRTHALRRDGGGRRTAALLSPSYGDGGADGRRDRPADGACRASVHLLLDTGHATGAGPIRRHWRSAIGGASRHVHAKDVRKDVMALAANKRDLSFLDSVSPGSTRCRAMAWWISPACSRSSKATPGWIVVEAEQDPAEGAAGAIHQNGL